MSQPDDDVKVLAETVKSHGMQIHDIKQAIRDLWDRIWYIAYGAFGVLIALCAWLAIRAFSSPQ